jgi:primosomal protein N' (replication factor Y)
MADRADVPEEELRVVQDVSPDVIARELLDLADAMAARYLCSLESCLRLVAPIGSTTGRGSRSAKHRDWVVRTDAAASPERVTARQAAVLAAIPDAGVAAKTLCLEVGVSRGVLLTLEKKGLLELGGRAHEGEQGEEAGKTEAGQVGDIPTLWPEQERAVTELTAVLGRPGISSRLLWGVTGSGKTEVYLRVIEHALVRGRGAILLVPEIALTPQTIRRVKSRFGANVGVFHSGLPAAERVREYRRVASGEASIVVGARSAIFAPVKNLGLIVVDESHDSSYKQEEEPRYHVTTVAGLRLERSGGLLLEGSATPAVESMATPEQRIRLTRRASGTPPELEVVDMRRQGEGLLLAPRAREALAEALRAGDQAILLLNRRGYAGYVHCDACGHVLMCTDCELSLTFHRRDGRLL